MWLLTVPLLCLVAQVVQAVLEAKANLEATTTWGSTPLIVSVEAAWRSHGGPMAVP